MAKYISRSTLSFACFVVEMDPALQLYREGSGKDRDPLQILWLFKSQNGNRSVYMSTHHPPSNCSFLNIRWSHSRDLDLGELLVCSVPDVVWLQQIEGALLQSVLELVPVEAGLCLEEVVDEALGELLLNLVVDLEVVRDE